MFYIRYTRSQERSTPQFQKMRALLKEKYGEDVPQPLRQDFCRPAPNDSEPQNISAAQVDQHLDIQHEGNSHLSDDALQCSLGLFHL
mgnify:CR=1 FL=1